MNINLKFLLLGTSLSLIPQYAAAQCAVTDCQQLGYTSLKSCDGGLKCPFGEYWACPCDESYKYACTGNNEQAGTDKCGERYKSCTCTNGYEWKDGKCQTKGGTLGECTGYAKNCAIGQILNSDGTCTTNKETDKTPIGIVVYIGSDNCGQALALKDLGSMIWSTEYVDIPDLPNYTSVSAAEKDFDSCGNTQKIIKQGGSNTYPAAWATVNYAPSSVPATKGKWCLPAAGVARSMMNNYDKINFGLSNAGGELLPDLSHDHWTWSSSENLDARVWAWSYTRDDLFYLFKDFSTYYVRPILAF